MDLYILFACNFIAFVLFAYDKHLAHYGLRRIPEAVLLASAAIFGGFGALVAMIFFHHKTKKKNFLIAVPILACVQIALDVIYRMFIL